MDIQANKIALVKEILDINNIDLIQKIAELIKTEKKDFWDELTVQEQNEIEYGLKELNDGKRVTFDSVIKKIS